MAKKKSARAKGGRDGNDEEVDFESALAEVERIVSELENGQLDLTESLRQYERGVRRLKSCHAILEAAERQVTLLSGFDADGNPVTEPLAEATGEQEKPRVRKRRTKAKSISADEGGQSSLEDSAGDNQSMDDSPGLF
ncbi:MAG: exodeoxyribonuclease VII small subunit [Pirellulales bacterium]|nr:exodeoxyribonuclease VII small subunit [Pirellulales bacterium]